MKIHCDRCNKQIFTWDAKLEDAIKKEYPSKTICQDCFLEIEIGAGLAKRDLENAWKPGTALKKMMALYGMNCE